MNSVRMSAGVGGMDTDTLHNVTELFILQLRVITR